jgi:hypothetical protein
MELSQSFEVLSTKCTQLFNFTPIVIQMAQLKLNQPVANMHEFNMVYAFLGTLISTFEQLWSIY